METTSRDHGTASGAAHLVDASREGLSDLVREAKPHLRGWLHLGMVPVAIACAALLILLASSTEARVAGAVFGATGIMLFATSATYHRGKWSPKVARTLKRLDHANIFLIIAGTYTPFALLLLPRGQGITLLAIVWGGAVLGTLFRVLWIHAPRWLYTPVYVALGWVAIFYFGPMLREGSVAIMTLIAAGGLFYTVGAVVYGTKRPNPSPRWFGFHEVFHAFTIAAFACHVVAASLTISSQAA